MKDEIAKKFPAVFRGATRAKLYDQAPARETTVECLSRVQDTVRHEICDWWNLFPQGVVWDESTPRHVKASYHSRKPQQS